jgi:polysaccharide biosynthesis protein PslH
LRQSTQIQEVTTNSFYLTLKPTMSEQIKRLLIITIELPYPPTSGGRMKSWNMTRFLSHEFEVGLVCPLKYGSVGLADMEAQLKLRHFLTDTVEVERNAKSLISSYLHCVPINVLRSGSQKLKHEVAKVANEYDAILLDHYESFQYLPHNFKGAVFLHTHNATYLMWERYAASDANLALRAVTWLEAQRVKAYERRATRRADLIFAAPNDIDSLAAIGAPRERCRVTYHLGDDSQLELPDLKFENTEKALLYVGTLNWEANVDGLLWFFESVWPAIKVRHPDLIFYVVGGKPDQRLLMAAQDLQGVEFTGFVEDLEPLFSRCRLFMAPLRFGSGIKVKVLNAMCRGLPTITTPVGSEGLSAQNMLHLSITESAPAMVDAMNTLLTDKQSWQVLEHESRELVRAHYTWKRVLGNMVEEIRSIPAP